MTRQRNDNHSTEFGLWLRKQPEIDSSLGFTATNVDFIWRNFSTNEWMIIEEKRYKGNVTFAQAQSFQILDVAAHSDPNYKGLFCLVFDKTNPEDGLMRLDGDLISKDQLIKFLRFEDYKEFKLRI